MSNFLNKPINEEYVRVDLVMPKSLQDRLNDYCNSVMKGKPRLKSAVIRNVIVEFLDKQKEN